MDINLKEIAVYVVLIIVVLLAAQHLNVVVSGSMEPVMYRGDIVVLEQANLLGFHEFSPDDVKVGDIVEVKVLSVDINKKRIALTMIL